MILNISIIKCIHIHWCIHIIAVTLVPSSGSYLQHYSPLPVDQLQPPLEPSAYIKLCIVIQKYFCDLEIIQCIHNIH